MRFVFPAFENHILDGEQIVLLCIEDAGTFTRFSEALYLQINGETGPLVLSEKEKQINLATAAELISDPFVLELNSRKAITKLYQSLKERMDDNGSSAELILLANQIHALVDDLVLDAGHVALAIDSIVADDILKLCKVQFDLSQCESIFERIVAGIKIKVEYEGKRFFILSRLFAYLSKAEIDELVAFARREEIVLLCLESRLNDHFNFQGDRYLIIDSDLCEILRIEA